MPRNSHAPSAKRRVAVIHSASTLPRHQRPDGERERHREQRVPRVEHRGVDHHRGVAQQRVQARRPRRAPPRGHERRRGEHQQAGEERGEARRAPRWRRRDVAHPLARQEQHQARPHRQQPDPQQQRALLRAPDRGHLVEGRRGRRLCEATVANVKSSRSEGDLEDPHRDRQHAGQRVDRAARRRRDVAPLHAARRRCPRRPRRGRRRRRGSGRRGQRRHRTVYFLAVNFEGHFVTSESLLADERVARPW